MKFLSSLFLPITAPIRFIQQNFKATLLVLFILLVMSSVGKQAQMQPNLMQIDLFGEIYNADMFLEQIDIANKENIYGVFINIDSPGGAVAPSVEMMMAIRDLAKKKPVVVYASGMMTSGSYYAGIGATKIYANPGAIIGSIGVIMQTANIAKLLSKVGVELNIIKSGEFKDVGVPNRPQTKKETQYLQNISNEIYKMFVADVKRYRSLAIDEKNFADGKIFVAKKAKKLKLIDDITSLLKARQKLVEFSGVRAPIWYQKSEFEEFFEQLQTKTYIFLRSLANERTQILAM